MDYATLQWAQIRTLNIKSFAPEKRVYTWLWANSDTRIPIMIDFIKYCYNIGVYDFVIFDNDILNGVVGGGGHARWNTILAAVNTYVDTLNMTTLGYESATISRIGQSYMKY
jgi:hypothetical protein